MRVISDTTPLNPDRALHIALRALAADHHKTDSRNGPCLRFKTPVTTVWADPTQRISWSPLRDANPFLHYIEAFWMLSGANDVETVGTLAKNMYNYSDDGSTLYGAYGYRWRRHFGFDQIQAVVQELRANPTTRRCVLQMWDGYHELGRATSGGKDVCCLAGDTMFRSPEGDISIKELAKKFQSGAVKSYPIYTADFASKDWDIKIANCTKAWSVGKKKTFKVTLDDGTSFRATDDHRFFVKKRSGTKFSGGGVTISSVETFVRDLKVGDILCAGVIKDVPGGYRNTKIRIRGNTAFGSFKPEHRMYHEFKKGPIPEGFIVHHKDGNKSHNVWSNLQSMHESAHLSAHRAEDNPSNTMSAAKKVARGRTHSAALTASMARYAELFPGIHSVLNKPKDRLTRTNLALVNRYKKFREKEALEQAAKQSEVSAANHRAGIVRMASYEKRKPILKKIVSIEAHGLEEVFDFTVPKTHNAMLTNGVFTHNCNHAIAFDPCDGYLNMTVSNRSNDIVWGAYGANVVHMSILHEYVAKQAGLKLGTYYQVSNNLHLYLDLSPVMQRIAGYDGSVLTPVAPDCDLYAENQEALFSDFTLDDSAFVSILGSKFEEFNSGKLTVVPDDAPRALRILGDLMLAFACYKSNGPRAAVLYLESVNSGDSSHWYLNAIEWLKRRPSYAAQS